MVRDSKIERIEANNAFRTGEKFQLVQPMSVHGGLQPKDVISVEAGPWNERGRRSFEYFVEAEQADPNGTGDHRDRAAHRQVSRRRRLLGRPGRDQPDPARRDREPAGRVEQKNMEERERVVRFLMDIGWHAEAKQELDRLVADFPQPELKERAAIARQFILQVEATDRRSAIDVSRKAQQYHRAAELLKSFNEKGIPTELQVEVREIERQDLQQHAADQAMAAETCASFDQPAIRDAKVLEGAGRRSVQGHR